MFASKIDYPRVELKNKEFSKVDRFLTCRSLLFTKRKLFVILSSSYFTNLALLNPNKIIEEENVPNEPVEQVKQQPKVVTSPSPPKQVKQISPPTPAMPTKSISIALPANFNSFISTPLFSSLRKNSGQKA